jgi:hypothetical protein
MKLNIVIKPHKPLFVRISAVYFIAIHERCALGLNIGWYGEFQQ